MAESKLDMLRKGAIERDHRIVDEKLESKAQALLSQLIKKNSTLVNMIEKVLTENPDIVKQHVTPDAQLRKIQQDGIKFLDGVQENVNEHFNDVEKRVQEFIQATTDRMYSDIHRELKRIESSHERTFSFIMPDGKVAKLTNAHKSMPELARHLSQHHDVAIIGPSGSGKTHAVRQCAEAMGLPFYFIACSDMDTPTKWFGTLTVTGGYLKTIVRTWYEEGGVLLIDEYDNMRSNIGVSLNAMLENGIGDFPDGIITRHEQAYCVAAGNTVGRGATKLYRGRHGLDESTLERFDYLMWDYDEELEMKIAPLAGWTIYVQACRRVMRKHKMDSNYIISPRASIRGGRLLMTGLHPLEVEKRVMFKAWPDDDYKKVKNDHDVSEAFLGIESAEDIRELLDQEFEDDDPPPWNEVGDD